ncbi:MAG: MFS transporter [Rhodospirillales bacterium]|nr:MFS transporter [Rhodospirillales bacterium]
MKRTPMPILFLIVLIDLIGFGVIIPLLPFYAEYFRATPDVVTLVMATYSLAQLFSAPLWGSLSDRIGRRPVLLFSLGGATLSYVGLGFADELWILFAARAFGGAMAGNIAAAFAYVADVTTPENRAKGMGLVGAAFGLGFIAGPAIGGVLAGPDAANADFQSPAFAAAGLSFAAFAMAIFLLKESLAPELRRRTASGPRTRYWPFMIETLRRPHLGLLIGVSFLATLVFAGMEATFAMWSERQFGWGPEQNGYLFAFVGILIAAVQGGLIGPLVRRFGEERLILQGTVALALGLVIIPLSESLAPLVAAMVIAAYGFSVTTPSLNSLISLRVGATEQGGVLGVARAATTLSRVVGPVCAGVLFAVFGKEWPFFAGAAVMVGVLFLGLRILKTKPRARKADR